MHKELKLWIAQSASWQSYVDFSLASDVQSKYKFIDRYDDFYISLLSNAYEILESNQVDEKKEVLFEIAKGLEIYSLREKRNHFNGINFYKNILYTSALYYLADYSASAFLLANLFKIENYNSEIDRFISGFLRRNLPENNYSDKLLEYLKYGQQEIIEELCSQIDSELNVSVQKNGQDYLSLLLAKRILDRFAVNNIWTDLLNYNSNEFWIEFVNSKVNKETPIWDFFPSQRQAILSGLITKNETVSIQMPTSSGKTAICELIAYNEFKNNEDCKILYLAPFRALASELKNSFGKSLRNLGVKVKTIYGGNIPTQEEKIAIESSNLLISTPEKFMAIEELDPELVNNFTIIICDEGHLIDDSNRGLSYELLLTRLKNEKRFIFISAIIPNISTINSWLGGKPENVIESNYRPTKLDFAFLEQSENSFMLNINPIDSIPINYKLNKFITQEEFYFLNPKTGRRKKYPQSEKTISSTTALKALPSGSVALFATSKGKMTGVRGLVDEINKQINHKLEFPQPIEFADHVHVEKLTEYFSYIFNDNYPLTVSARNGFLYHNGDLPQFIREIIEDSLRSNKIRLVICTNTLAEGVNLPIKTIVLYSISRKFQESDTKKWVSEFINLRDLKNLVGRAGRAGKETKGLIIATKPSEFEYLVNLIKDEEIEPVKGFLYNLVESLNRQIEKYNITLSNEILDKQNESFLKLLDLIDSSIIQLLDVDIKDDDIEKIIEELLNSTLSSFQATLEEQKVLLNLFSLRSQKLKPYIREDKFYLLKSSGATLREFHEYEQYINFDHEFFQANINPLDENWLTFILDETIFQFTSIKNIFEEYNISQNDLKQAIILWLQGEWYESISMIFNEDIDKTLNIVNRVIIYNVQTILGQVIKLVETNLIEKEIEISQQVLKFPQFVLYGTTKNTILDLIEIGFNERISNDLLGLLIDERYEYIDLEDLQEILLENEILLTDLIRNEVPKLSFESLKMNYDYLKYYG
jgi:helicase